MVSSFRLSNKEEQILQLLSKRTGKSRSDIVRAAIQNYYASLSSSQNKSSYDRLMDSGFKPISSGVGDLSHNKEKQRKIILERLKKDNR